MSHSVYILATIKKTHTHLREDDLFMSHVYVKKTKYCIDISISDLA